MKRNMRNIAMALVGVATLAGCGSDDSETSIVSGERDIYSEYSDDCFWVGPYVKEKPETNFAYPDTGAAYWHAGYTLPEGASLVIKGEFPYARYMSLNSYRLDASPAYKVADNEIEPTQGSVNPFVQSAQRDSEFRDYAINVMQGDAPEMVPVNTLYDSVAEGDKSVLLYRIYVPDAGSDNQGNVELPKVELTLNSGETLTGPQACAALASDQTELEIPVVPEATYAYLRGTNNPAQNSLNDDGVTVDWRAAYNAVYTNKCAFLDQCDTNPERQVNWYANLDNQYVTAFIDNSIKSVVVIRGKLPSVPETLEGAVTFDESSAQMRYWSICQNEYYSQKVTGCLFDEQVTILPDGEYLIVTSTEDNKPSNVSECGMDYLPWSADGDGFGMVAGRVNNVSDGLLIVRNMLPVNGFNETAQATQTPGDEVAVMVDYLPTAEYFTKAEFEALGCDAYTNWGVN